MPGISVATGVVMSLLLAASPWPDLSVQQPTIGGGERDSAIIVAVEEYAFLPHVAGASEVGAAWYRYMSNTRKVPDVQLLLNEDATAINIQDALEKAVRNVKSGGRVWFVFIGHGAPSKEGTDAVLVGVTAMANERNFYPQTVSRSNLLDILARRQDTLPPVVLLDACFSGTDSSGATLITGSQFVVSQELGTAKTSAATLLTAGRSYDIAGPLPGQPFPAFSYLVLGALRGWGDSDGNGVVTAQEAVKYAHKAILALAPGRMQEPQHSGLDQPLTPRLTLKIREPGPDLAAIKLALAGPKATMGTADANSLDAKLTLLEQAQQRKAEADALMEEARKQYRSQIDAIWERVKVLVAGGGQEGIDALAAFINEYAHGTFENHREAEARRALAQLRTLVAQEEAEKLVRQKQAATKPAAKPAANTPQPSGTSSKPESLYTSPMPGFSASGNQAPATSTQLESDDSLLSKWWFWTAIGVGAGLVGGGTYWLLAPSSDSNNDAFKTTVQW